MRWPWQRKRDERIVWQKQPATPIGSVPFFEPVPITIRVKRTIRYFNAEHWHRPDTLHVTPEDLQELYSLCEYLSAGNLLEYNGEPADGYGRFYGLRVIEASPIAPASTSYVSLELGENAVYDWREDLL